MVLALASKSLSAAVVILNGLTHVHPISSGQRVTGEIKLRNESDVAKRVLIYKQDLSSSCGEGIKYLEGASLKRSMSKWLNTTLDEKTLEPNEEFTLFYTIDLPSEIETGSFWSVLMIESANPLEEVQPNGVTVNSITRYAVQIIGDSGTSDKSSLLINDLNLEDISPEIKHMQITVRNNGIFSEKVILYLEVYDEDGNRVETFKGMSRRVYPEMCSSYILEVKGLPKGSYESVLVMDNGNDLFASNISLDID